MANAYLSDEEKQAARLKLKQIAGRINGLVTMLDENREHEDILIQISATYESLRQTARILIQNYTQQKVSTGLTAINKEKRDS